MSVITALTRSQALVLWDRFQQDPELSGEEWSSAHEALIRALGEHYTYTGRSRLPAEFWVGDDWFHTRGLAVVFLQWRFLCAHSLKLCWEFVSAQDKEWHVSVVKDGSAEGPDGPAIEVLLTRERCYVSAPKMSKTRLEEFLRSRTDLAQLKKPVSE